MSVDNDDDVRAALQDVAAGWAADDRLRERIRRLDPATKRPSRSVWPVAVAAAVVILGAATAFAVVDGGRDDGTAVTTDDTPGPSATAEWRALADAPIDGRAYAAAVWTGDEMIVWGGTSLDGQVMYDDGARYDPDTDAWTPMAASPSSGRFTVAAWTGTEMLLWGRVTGSLDDTTPAGVAYDPSADTWRVLPDGPVPSRPYAAGVWTGRELVVWGGYDVSSDGMVSGAADGAAYDPATATWRSVAPSPLDGRFYHHAVWTGTEVVVWGGGVGDGAEGTVFNDGAMYDPAADAWRPVAAAPLAGRYDAAMAWTGNGVIVWGGVGSGGDSTANGAIYSPAANAWDPLSATSTPDARRFLFGGYAWVGDRLAVLAADSASPLTTMLLGGPARPATTEPAPVDGRRHPAVVWTGRELLVWGGATPDGPVDDGAAWRYGPPQCSPAGAPTVIVPDLVGLTVAEARAAVADAGLVVGGASTPHLEDSPANATVSTHEPPAGSAVSPGACVGLRTEEAMAPLPVSGEPLAEGVHAVHVTAVDDATLTVDVVQWLSGADADEAYAAETGDTSGAPNDYYLRNTSTDLRTVPVDVATVSVAWRDTGPSQHDIRVEEFAEYVAQRNDPTAPYWITVRGGQITRITEQYRP